MSTATAPPKPAENSDGVGLYGRPKTKCAEPGCETQLRDGNETGRCAAHGPRIVKVREPSIASLMSERVAVAM